MKSFSQYKKDTKSALNGAWGRGALLLVLPVLPQLLLGGVEQVIRGFSGLPAFNEPQATFLQSAANPSPPSILLTLLMSFLCFLLWAPLKQGGTRWFFHRQENPLPGMGAFYYFESPQVYGRAIFLKLFSGLRIALWTGLILAPVLIWYWIPLMRPVEPGMMAPLFQLLPILWLCLGAILLKLASLRYFLAPYLRVVFPEERAGRLLKKSARLMAGRKGWVFLFQLSFLPWYVPGLGGVMLLAAGLAIEATAIRQWVFLGALGLGVLQTGISLLYVAPYRQAAMATCAGELLSGEPKEDMLTENITREYLSKALEDSLGKLPQGYTIPASLKPEPPPDAYRELPREKIFRERKSSPGLIFHYPPLIPSDGEDPA